ncbi:hypothetical protein C8Q75DRAFT_139436 [Abortiporus biennis]|nr:hypothetical protein C8Q75DRAFT_139436 [Abortiporus biennis]
MGMGCGVLMLLPTPLQQALKLLRDAFDTVERLIESVGTSTPSSDQDTEFYKLPHCSRQTATIDYSFSPILLIHIFVKMSVSSPDIDLPVELLIYILEFISSDLYKMYNTYLISRTLEFFSCQQFPPDIPKNFSSGRVSLSNTLLVCRTWYGAGATALYSQVHLFTERQLRLFARALKMNSSLSQLVRGFYATGFSPPSQSFFAFFGASNHNRLVRDILYIIKSCRYLQASNVDLDLKKPFMSDHPCIEDCNSYQFQCLRRLELHGDAMVPLLVHCQLPNLDFLHFRSCYFKNPNFLPVLSRLHTLVFTKCSGSPPIHNHPSPILPQNVLPSLRSLQCYDDNFVRPPLVFHPLPPTLCDIRHVVSWS